MTDGSQPAPLRSNAEPTPAQIRRWRRHLADERMEAQTYRNLAKRESEPQRSIMLSLAQAEGRHEAHWMALLGRHAYPPPRPRLTARLLPLLAARFGSVFTLALAQRSEQRTSYDIEADATEQMAADEHIHGEVVRSLAESSRERMAGNFRAAVFGINDGLISNLALTLGVAAAGMSSSWVITTGVAGLLGGSLSMGAGEWVSVSGQRELLDASLPDPDAERSLAKLDVNANELVLLFRARGESEEQAREHARAIFDALGQADLDTGMLALSLRPNSNGDRGEVVGKPFPVAFASFLFFALGALVPLLPYLFGMSGMAAIVVSAAVVGFTLLSTGALVGILSGKPAWFGALRQLGIGALAAGVTYALGALFGTGA